MSVRFGSRTRVRKAGFVGIIAAFLALMAWGPSSASADFITPDSGPLSSIFTGIGLTCQLNRESNEFDTGETEDYCATLAYSHDANSHGLYGNLDFTNESFYPQSQDQGGSGTAADPYTITTVVQALPQEVLTSAPVPAAGPVSPSLLTITQVDSYVNGDDFYRTDVTVHNDLNASQSVELYHVGDCRLEGDDTGYADEDSANGPVFCTPHQFLQELNAPAGNAAPAQQGPDPAILGFIPVGTDSNFLETDAGQGNGSLYDHPKAGDQFTNECIDCGNDPFDSEEQVDNGVGLSWHFDMAPGASERRCFFTVDSYDGNEPDVPASCTPSNPPTIAQQPPPVCKLRISRARVFLFRRHPRLRLVARYRSTDPADVNIKFTAVEGGNNVDLGTVTRHFSRHGLFRLREEITQDQSDTLWQTHDFIVHFKIPGEPGFCERQYTKELTKPRIVQGQRVVFQSDSKFPQPGAGHPQG